MADQLDFKAMAFMHDAPRFWHTRNIAVLASQDEAVKSDYIQGLVAFAIFILSFFVFWALSLAFFKLRGIKRYGCIAGQVVYKRNDEDKKAAYNRFQIIQYCFIVAVIGLFVGGIMMLKRGVPYLATAVSDIRELNGDLLVTLMEGEGVAAFTTDSIRSVHDPLAEIRNYTVFPDYCADKTAIATYKIQTSLEEIVDHMDGVQDFLDRYEFEGLEGNLNIMVKRSHMLGDALSAYIGNDWISKMYVMVIGIVSFFLCCYSMVTSWCNLGHPAVKFMTSYFLLPAFFLSITAGWLLTIAFGVGSAMNSDFCIGDGVIGPEATIQEALVQYGIKEDHLMFQSFLYYQSQCTTNNPWDRDVGIQVSSIQETINILHTFQNPTNITNACGTSITPILNQFEILARELPKLVGGMERGMDLARCEKVLPLYQRVFDGASCSESLRGFAWSFYAMFALSLCGVLMFSLRSALYHIKAVHDDDMRENLDIFDEKIDWDEFTKNQVGDNDSDWVEHSNEKLPIQKKRSEDNTHITFNVADEERGVEVDYFDSDQTPLSPTALSPTAQSNQSSIDTNECFDDENDDDGVNSFNSELEPLTPTPTSMNTLKDIEGGPSSSSPTTFTFKGLVSPTTSLKKNKRYKSRKEDDTSKLL